MFEYFNSKVCFKGMRTDLTVKSLKKQAIEINSAP